MYITIRQEGQESQKRRRHKGGFTLPEVLVSLLICVFVLQGVGQWGVLTQQSRIRMQQNQQAVLLAQAVLAGNSAELPDGWEIVVKKQEIGDELIEQELTIIYGNQSWEKQTWQFYYVGQP